MSQQDIFTLFGGQPLCLLAFTVALPLVGSHPSPLSQAGRVSDKGE